MMLVNVVVLVLTYKHIIQMFEVLVCKHNADIFICQQKHDKYDSGDTCHMNADIIQ